MKTQIVVWLLVVFACSLAAPAEKAPQVRALPLGLTGAAPLQANGAFVISVERRGRWQEVGRLGEDRFLREQRLDLSAWLDAGAKARVRVRQEGGGASHLDAVLLGGRAPLATEPGLRSKLGRRDNDLVNAGGRDINLTFTPGGDRLLTLAGRIESPVIGTEPLQFPMENTFRVPSASSSFYSYRLGSAAPPRQRFAGRAWLDEVERRPALFEALSATGSGHPTGYTYGWVSNDRHNLYVTIDFTPDNTCDGDKDYAKVYARGNGQVREFKVSVPEGRWGRAHFVYTDKAAYQHKVYDFAIPLSELPALGPDLDLCFAAYGTASATTPDGVNLAYDAEQNRYLLVYSFRPGTSTDVMGRFVATDGSDIGASFFIAANPALQEVRPIVAFDSVNRRYLVAWYESLSGTNYIRGQLLADDGSPLGASFIVHSSSSGFWSDAIAFDSVNQRYLVAWTTTPVGGSEMVFGALRDRNGDAVWVDGDPYFAIGPKGGNAYDVAAAFDSQSELYMVVWENQGSSPMAAPAAALPSGTQIVGQMVDSSGGLSGELFAVTSGEDFHGEPAVANDNGRHRFLVAWIQAVWDSPDIAQAAQRQWASGRLQDLPSSILVVDRLFDNTGGTIGNEHPVSTVEGMDQQHPRLAFDPLHGRYLAIFQSDEFTTTAAERRLESAAPIPFSGVVTGQFLDGSGVAIETSPAANFPVGVTTVPYYAPALASESACGTFLAAWSQLSDPRPARAQVGEGCVRPPTVETLPVSAVTTTGASGGGTVTSDGGAKVTARGVCWNTTGHPNLAGAHTGDGSGTGTFASHLSGLLPDVTYHVRAYAVNNAGTAYGSEVTFTTARWVVTFLADGGGALSGQTPQYVADGGSCTPVEAQAASGFFFLRWDGSDASSPLANPLTVANVHGDLTFTARFGTLGLSVARRIEHAWIIRAEYADIEITVSGLTNSGAAKFLLLRRAGGGDWEQAKEILPGEFKDGRYTFASLPLDPGKTYGFRVEARSSSGALLGASAEVTI